MTFFVPNLHLHYCCSWIAKVETLVGIGLVLGFLTRACGAAILFLLLYSFAKFSVADCIDLTPMYGLAIYFLVAGRGKWSLDRALRLTNATSPLLLDVGFMSLRVSAGLGLICLGFDEKIINPQLALNLLQHTPVLNFMQFAGMSNDMFVLCGGVTEVVIGLMLACGKFPRIFIVALAGLFAATTAIFGATEFIGHLPYYGIIMAVFLRGSACTHLLPFVQRIPSMIVGLKNQINSSSTPAIPVPISGEVLPH